MQKPVTLGVDTKGEFRDHGEACHCGMSWRAILGGAAVIAALSSILLMFATGLGFTFSSPWSDKPLTAGQFTLAAAVWMILIQWIPSGFGGYLTGRLRKNQLENNSNETFFRDTAQGLIAWAVAALVGIGILLLTGLLGATVLGAVAQAVGHYGNGQAQSAGPMSYYVDGLFRANLTGTPVDKDTKDEVARILMKGAMLGPMRDDDRTYLAQLVATRTGMEPAAASGKVDDAVTQIRNAANKARKSAASALIFTFLSMLIGAFTASAMAAMGGQHRDERIALGRSNARRQ